jgi:ribosome-binding protein aMBF1 (putative translation factor)
MNNKNQKIEHDDDIWNQVTIIRGKVAAAEKKRDGRMQAVEKRSVNMSNEAIAQSKLDKATEVVKLKQNTKEFGQLVTKARIAKGYNTQKKLALALQEKVENINDIENGKGKYNGKLVGKLKNFLKLNKL